jgi:peptide/nickel transport system substrate-binding protein
MDIDPAWSYDTASAELLMNVYEPLLWFNRTETGEYTPMLATEWHWVAGTGKYYDDSLGEYVTTSTSPEGYTWAGRWEFTIRSGVKFHDDGVAPKHSWEGKTLTTEDVEHTFERFLVVDCSTGPSWMMWDPLFGASWAGEVDHTLTSRGFPVNETTGWNTKVDEAIDHGIERNATHVWFNLIMPYPPFLQIVAQQWGSIMCKDWLLDTTIPGHQYEWPGMQVGDAWADYHDPGKSALYYVSTASPGPHLDAMLGTGPYMFNYWNTGAGGVWSVVKNNNYWRGWSDYDGLHPAHVTEFQSWYIPEWSTRRLRFLGGISDFCAVPRMYMNEILGKPGIDCMYPLVNLAADGCFYTFLVSSTSTRMGTGPLVNATLTTGWSSTNSPVNIFNFSDVRRAFAHAFDYQSFLEAAYLNEAYSPTTPILDILAPNVAQPGQPEDPVANTRKMYGISDEPANTLAYNLTLAAEYLKKVPGLWTNGFTMDFVYNEGNLMREMAARLLKDGLEWISANVAGAPKFTITVSMIPWSVYKLEWKAHNLPYFIVGWLADYPDAHNFAHPFMHSAGAFSRWQGYVGVTEFPTAEIDQQIALGITDPNRAVHYQWLNQKYVDLTPGFILDTATGRHFQRNWVDTGAIGPAPGTYDPLHAPLWKKTQEGTWYYNPIYPGEYVYDIYKNIVTVQECDVAVTAFTKEPVVSGYVALVNRSDTIQMYKAMPLHVTVARLDSHAFYADFVVGVVRRDSSGYEVAIDSQLVLLGPGDSEIVDFLWNETELTLGETYNLYAVVYPSSPYASDTNMANNQGSDPPFQVVWYPDCNGPVEGIWAEWPSVGDNQIEGKDLRALMRSWPPAGAYHDVCDYDVNGVIDSKDQRVLMRFWGKGYPP